MLLALGCWEMTLPTSAMFPSFQTAMIAATVIIRSCPSRHLEIRGALTGLRGHGALRRQPGAGRPRPRARSAPAPAARVRCGAARRGPASLAPRGSRCPYLPPEPAPPRLRRPRSVLLLPLPARPPWPCCTPAVSCLGPPPPSTQASRAWLLPEPGKRGTRSRGAGPAPRATDTADAHACTHTQARTLARIDGGASQ